VNRRSFFAAIAGAFVIDPERALWVPGAKLISIPAVNPRETLITLYLTARGPNHVPDMVARIRTRKPTHDDGLIMAGSNIVLKGMPWRVYGVERSFA
jgi:hypothetical protein